MHFSTTFRSSPHRGASPDGRMVASLTSAAIVIRSTDSLQTISTVRLPSDLSGPVGALLWSPSSTKVLVSTADQIHVFSAADSSFHAVVRTPVTGNTRPAHIAFGHDDTEVLVFSSFGLKLLIFDLTTSKAVEINGPKFHHPSTAAKTYSLRAATGHIALLTRVGGRDLASIHSPASRQLQRSWYPDTTDAQAICWSPDSQWLLVLESPAHGWRLLLYTPDGQLVRTLSGFHNKSEEDAALEPGIRLCHFSPSKELLAVGDFSRKVAILRASTWRETVALVHPSTVSPSETLQIWQEQLHGPVAAQQQPTRSFLRATQEITPPGPPPDAKASPESKSGCALVAFDASSCLLATRLEDAPSTIWVWDLTAAELRAVLLFHAPVEFCWHPSTRELLLITTVDGANRGVPFIWDPLSDGPKDLPIEAHLPDGKDRAKISATWINWEKETPAVFLSNSQHYCLADVSDAEAASDRWADYQQNSLGGSTTTDHSLLRGSTPARGDDTSILDDTFSFKHR